MFLNVDCNFCISVLLDACRYALQTPHRADILPHATYTATLNCRTSSYSVITLHVSHAFRPIAT